jgi:hypothetical protein
MARIQGIDPRKTSFLMQQAFRSVRKIFGKDLTPQKNLGPRPARLLVEHDRRAAARRASQSSAAATLHRVVAHGGAHRLPVLNRHQFCRRQNVWTQR